jgi:hypothetical protein
MVPSTEGKGTCIDVLPSTSGPRRSSRTDGDRRALFSLNIKRTSAPCGCCCPPAHSTGRSATVNSVQPRRGFFVRGGLRNGRGEAQLGQRPPAAPRHGCGRCGRGGGAGGCTSGPTSWPGPTTHRGRYGPAATPRLVHRRRGSEGSRARAPSQPAQGLCEAPSGTAEVAPARSQDARAASAARCIHGSRTSGSRTAPPVRLRGAAAGWGPGGRVPQVVNSQDMVTVCLWAH